MVARKVLSDEEVWKKIARGDKDFRDVDLSGMDLAGIDFTRAYLTGADLTAADITNITLTDAELRGAKLSAESGIITFQGIRYFAFFHKSKAYPKGYLLQVGCKSYYDLDFRIKIHSIISDYFGYSEAERAEMLGFIMSLEINPEG